MVHNLLKKWLNVVPDAGLERLETHAKFVCGQSGLFDLPDDVISNHWVEKHCDAEEIGKCALEQLDALWCNIHAHCCQTCQVALGSGKICHQLERDRILGWDEHNRDRLRGPLCSQDRRHASGHEHVDIERYEFIRETLEAAFYFSVQ